MKIWKIRKLQSLALGALSVASMMGCAANAVEAQEETTATTGEAITLTGSAAGDGTQAYRWKAGDSPKVMSKSADTYCFLTEFEGISRGAADQVYIVDNTVSWILTGETASGTSTLTHKAAARCVIRENTTKKIWHWPESPTDLSPNPLKPASTHTCVLTGFGGGFLSSTDYVRTVVKSDGKWYLEGQSSSGNVHGDATCIPNPPFAQDIPPLVGTGSTQAMLPLTYFNSSPIGPAACGLTQIGGALGSGGFGGPVLDAKIVLNETLVAAVPSPGWKWLLTVGRTDRKTSADVRCFQ